MSNVICLRALVKVWMIDKSGPLGPNDFQLLRIERWYELQAARNEASGAGLEVLALRHQGREVKLRAA